MLEDSVKGRHADGIFRPAAVSGAGAGRIFSSKQH
jgi:hypothetical protein